MVLSKPTLTEFGIHYRLESCEFYIKPTVTDCHNSISVAQIPIWNLDFPKILGHHQEKAGLHSPVAREKEESRVSTGGQEPEGGRGRGRSLQHSRFHFLHGGGGDSHLCHLQLPLPPRPDGPGGGQQKRRQCRREQRRKMVRYKVIIEYMQKIYLREAHFSVKPHYSTNFY